MTENEILLFEELLERLENYFSCSGCGDYCLPDTPENREIFEKVESYINTDDPEYGSASAEDCVEKYGKLLFMDWQLFSFLKKKVFECIKTATESSEETNGSSDETN